jgi:hypothetical protein
MIILTKYIYIKSIFKDYLVNKWIFIVALTEIKII